MGLSSPSWCSDTLNNGLELLRSHFGDAKHNYNKPLSSVHKFYKWNPWLRLESRVLVSCSLNVAFGAVYNT